MNAAQIIAAVPYGRQPETDVEVVARAYDLIDRYGLASRHAGYGSHTEGFSLEGGVYEALMVRDDFFSLREAPERVYHLSDAVFQLLAAALGKPGLKPGKAQTVVIETSYAWATESRYGTGRTQALELLSTVFAELAESAVAA